MHHYLLCHAAPDCHLRPVHPDHDWATHGQCRQLAHLLSLEQAELSESAAYTPAAGDPRNRPFLPFLQVN